MYVCMYVCISRVWCRLQRVALLRSPRDQIQDVLGVLGPVLQMTLRPVVARTVLRKERGAGGASDREAKTMRFGRIWQPVGDTKVIRRY
jgi:hypothetical protein